LPSTLHMQEELLWFWPPAFYQNYNVLLCLVTQPGPLLSATGLVMIWPHDSSKSTPLECHDPFACHHCVLPPLAKSAACHICGHKTLCMSRIVNRQLQWLYLHSKKSAACFSLSMSLTERCTSVLLWWGNRLEPEDTLQYVQIQRRVIKFPASLPSPLKDLTSPAVLQGCTALI
jgi:hypothetical protein